MNDDQHKSVQIKKNHITNGRMVEKTNDPKTIVKGYSTLISNTVTPFFKHISFKPFQICGSIFVHYSRPINI